MTRLLSLFTLLCLFGFSAQRSMPDDTSYIAAVVEYQVQENSTLNLQNYIQLIQDAAIQDADIVVFPEMTLTVRTHVTVPVNGLLKDHPIPALQPELYDEILVAVSSAAKENGIYVLINVEEVVNCSGGIVTGESCPDQKIYFFNTNIVFDRNGTVIDRYRKINLFGEYTRTPALSPDLGIFSTDFGVTFGHFICFDLMFQVPAVQIVQKYNITDIIFSTMWFSELPYLTAVQIQEAYAYSMNVNFLGAGANNVRVGSAGSGIYSGKAGALISIMPGIPTTKLLVAKVPKVPGEVDGAATGPIKNSPSDQDNLYLLTDSSLASHVTRLLTSGYQEFTLADEDVVCYFRVQLADRNGDNAPYYRAFVHDGVNVYAKRDIGTAGCMVAACKTEDVNSCVYRYRAAVFSGVRSFSGVATGGLRICSIFACTNDTLESCGRRFPQYSANSTGVFEGLNITAAVPVPVTNDTLSAKSTVYYPVSLDTSLMPLRPDSYSFEERNILDALFLYTFNLLEPADELYSFAVWGREYTTDGDAPTNNDSTETTTTPAPEDPDPGSSNIHRLHLVVLYLCILCLLWI